MDDFYRGLESSLLGIGLLLGLAVTSLTVATSPSLVAELAVTLPMIEVQAER